MSHPGPCTVSVISMFSLVAPIYVNVRNSVIVVCPFVLFFFFFFHCAVCPSPNYGFFLLTVPSQESEWSCICLIGASTWALSAICWLEFGTVLIVWNVLLFMLFYHLRLRIECNLACNLQSRARTHAVLVIGLYELLGNPTT
jgi:hypothetical protein